MKAETKRAIGECQRCGSPAPHLHPAVQCEGEVQLCSDAFHLTPTPQNRPAYIAEVQAIRAALSNPQENDRG